MVQKNLRLTPFGDSQRVRFSDHLLEFGAASWYLGLIMSKYFHINIVLTIAAIFIVYDFFIERDCKAQDARDYAVLCEKEYHIHIRGKDEFKHVEDVQRTVQNILTNGQRKNET